MTEALTGRPVVRTKPEPDIYTVLLIVVIVCLAATIGIVLYNLMTPLESGGYGLSLGDLFKPAKDIVSGK